MAKSLYSKEYDHFLRIFRDMRGKSKLTQEQIAARIRQTQTFVSKCERGERRIDFVELHTFCKAFGISMNKFVKAFEKT